jgi:hypothetical protein
MYTSMISAYNIYTVQKTTTAAQCRLRGFVIEGDPMQFVCTAVITHGSKACTSADVTLLT